MTTGGRSRAGAIAAAGCLALLAGCSLSPDAEGAGAAARAFHAALAAEDAGAACALLAPATRQELEDSAEQPCAEALTTSDLPSASEVRDVAAYVRSARVVLDADVVFLSRYDGTWLVRAAGCVRVGDSYDCAVQSG